MNWVVILALLVLAVLIIARLLGQLTTSRPKPEPNSAAHADHFQFELNQRLLSAAEHSFIGVLEEALSPGHRVMSKVRVADVLSVKAANKSQWQRGFNAISSKHFDFVVCDRATSQVLFAVELDDRSHERESRRQRDALVDRACTQAGLKLIRVRAQRTYSLSEVRDLLPSSPAS